MYFAHSPLSCAASSATCRICSRPWDWARQREWPRSWLPLWEWIRLSSLVLNLSECMGDEEKEANTVETRTSTPCQQKKSWHYSIFQKCVSRWLLCCSRVTATWLKTARHIFFKRGHASGLEEMSSNSPLTLSRCNTVALQHMLPVGQTNVLLAGPRLMK